LGILPHPGAARRVIFLDFLDVRPNARRHVSEAALDLLPDHARRLTDYPETRSVDVGECH